MDKHLTIRMEDKWFNPDRGDTGDPVDLNIERIKALISGLHPLEHIREDFFQLQLQEDETVNSLMDRGERLLREARLEEMKPEDIFVHLVKSQICDQELKKLLNNKEKLDVTEMQNIVNKHEDNLKSAKMAEEKALQIRTGGCWTVGTKRRNTRRRHIKEDSMPQMRWESLQISLQSPKSSLWHLQ